MSGDAQRGRNIILLIIVAIVLPQVFAIAAALILGNTRTAAAFGIRLGIAIAMSSLMWRGYSAARSYVAFMMFVGAVLTVLGPFGFIGVVFGAGYLWAAWTLWKSPSVEAYIEAKEAARNPVLSIRDGDGV